MPVALPVEDMPPVAREIPADGDNYAYAPRKPLIPPQWVPVSEYHALVELVSRLDACLTGALEIQRSTLDLVDALTSRVIEMEKRLADREGD